MEIKAADVKALREKTGAGMMECKKALVECNGNEEEAIKLLKEKGLAAVAKRSERATKEGRIFIKTEGSKVVIAEVTCETDFVANNADFVACGQNIVDTAMAKGYSSVNDELKGLLEDFAAKTRENMGLRRLEMVEVPAGCVMAKYVHSDNKTGVIVVLKTEPASSDAKIAEFAYDCALHIAAFNPAYITRADVPQSYIDEQTEIFKAQLDQDEKMASKPENVKAGILQGKINKHLADVCFMDQMFVKDDKVTVAKKIDEVAKSCGCKIKIEKIVNYVLGA
ncbi:MAG: elongation factor Ts [Spirochaetaceae bacterium]|nr:elongation factor Ts [Spirochaetaceae bacterium]MDD6486178.1 translation elongation factor Ts [Spirochaetales bacterium]